MNTHRDRAIRVLGALAALAALGTLAQARTTSPLTPWLDAEAASQRVEARFEADSFSYPSLLLDRVVLVEELGHETLLPEGTLITLRVRADAVGDLDADGIVEAALIVTEERCRRDVCEVHTRLDLWSAREQGVTQVASWPLPDDGKGEWTDVYIRDGVLRAWRHLCCLDDEGLSRDDEHRWRFDGLEVRPVDLREGPVYYPDEEGC